ncbi:unnamed protein product [Effrenium voratum]|uniref:Uncharacterized protein n=1 Tax=Effrenium voratum TaxID=2562239 RepID=A0AA36J5G0_9DINO|nr:unnamed protein product [Effrenium voratum]CAJ1450772.1 unnamed protein product [Effrenium voratum]
MVRFIASLVAIAGGCALLFAWWLWAEVPQSEEYTLLFEDERLTRFSEHCAAEVFLEELPALETGAVLHSAVVFLGHGEVSPSQGWPDDPRPSWDCRPADLPRHWRLNQQVEFQALAPDGQLERSFDPELLPDDPMEPRARRCAKGQLTAGGFKQAVLAGRRLVARYGEALAEATLEVLSLPQRPCLATAAGALLPLLPGFTRGTVSITTLASGTFADVPDADAFRESEDLMARWCHEGTLPCSQQGCLTPAHVAAKVNAADAELCAEVKLARWLQTATSKSRLTLLSLGVAEMAQVFRAVRKRCERPALGSLLVLERWVRNASAARWRVLWNGLDISENLCPGEQMGCDEGLVLDRLG